MKKLGVVVMVLLMASLWGVSAQGKQKEWWERVSLDAGPMMVIGNSEDNQGSELGYGAKVRVRVELGEASKKSPVRFEVWPWGSYDTRNLRLYGQRAGSLSLWGVGGGVGVSFLKYLTVYGEFGYYFPDYSMKGERTIATGAESLVLDFGDFIKSTGFSIPLREFESFERKFSGNVGGTIGVGLNYPLGKHWKVGLDFGYRFLWLEEYKKAYLPAGWHCLPGRPNIETKEMHNYGGIEVRLGILFTF